MLTRCPKCETIFKVSKKHISAAKGLVRCGSCKDIFNAKDHVIKSKKDLKLSETKPETKTVTQPQENIRVNKKPKEKQKVVNQLPSSSEPESFDFLSDGFTSELARDQFNLTQSPSANNNISKTPAKNSIKNPSKDKKISSSDLDKLFGNNNSPDEALKSNAPAAKKAKAVNQKNLNLATFSSSIPQPHKATIIKPNSEKKENKTGNFITQNVTEFKNAFTSLTNISKKLTTKVVNKIQTSNSDDEHTQEQNKTPHQSPLITETTLTSTTPEKSEAVTNKTANISTTKQSKTSSAPRVKSKPKLQEDTALKLAIQLKKAALEKTKLEQAKLEKTKSATQIKPEVKESKPNLQVIANNDVKKTQATTKPPEKPKPAADTKLTPEKTAAKKEAKQQPEETVEENQDDSQIQIHIENGDIPMMLRESLEEFDIPSRSIQMTFIMFMSLIVLVAGLLLQFAVFRSIEVQQKYPNLKPIITRVCQTFECIYNGSRDVKKIQLISRDIRVHPNTKGALLINATIMNNASYQQPYPNFSVKLSNLTGKTVAHRFFSPNDYLGKLSKTLLLMPPKQPIRVSLEVVDPGKEAINFEFKFLSRQ